jgi:hypothetical protein
MMNIKYDTHKSSENSATQWNLLPNSFDTHRTQNNIKSTPLSAAC